MTKTVTPDATIKCTRKSLPDGDRLHSFDFKLSSNVLGSIFGFVSVFVSVVVPFRDFLVLWSSFAGGLSGFATLFSAEGAFSTRGSVAGSTTDCGICTSAGLSGTLFSSGNDFGLGKYLTDSVLSPAYEFGFVYTLPFITDERIDSL